MNILVCMKAVPSTGQVQVDGQFKLLRDGAKLEWNIADQAALEAAIRLKGTDGRISLLTMGPSKLADSLRELIARGADRAVLVTDPAFAGSDTIATANTLYAAIKSLGNFDLILCGRRAIDGETGQVPAMLASKLGIPCISNVDSIVLSAQSLQVERLLEDRTEKLLIPCPAVISVCEYSYSLRLPGIMAMRKARNTNVEILTASDLLLNPSECGLSGSLTKVIAMDSKFPGLRNGTIERDITTGVSSLLSIIKEVRA